MIVCTSCSHQNEDDDEFCGSCGKFLEWVGEKIVDPAPARTEATPTATVTAAKSTATDAPLPHVVAPTFDGTLGDPGVGAEQLQEATAALDQTRVMGPERSASGSSDAAGVATEPIAQKPTRTVAAPRPDPRTSAPPRALQPGDRVCGQCGAGNEPARSFCRRCGGSLAQAATAPKAPWYKRILARPPAGAPPAGTRPTGRRASGRSGIGRIVGLLALAAILAALAIPSTRNAARDAGERVVERFQEVFGGGKTDPARPVTVEASSAAPGHPDEFLTDLSTNTFWAENAEGEGINENVAFNFGRKVNLHSMVITSGAQDAVTSFVQQPRPRGLHIAYDTGASTDVELTDSPEPQLVRLDNANEVTVVNVAITSVYPSTAGGQATSITEIEFNQKG